MDNEIITILYKLIYDIYMSAYARIDSFIRNKILIGNRVRWRWKVVCVGLCGFA